MLKHIQRTLYLSLGWLFVVLGVVGIALPLLPTTPFLLLAAFCFSKSSVYLHNQLLSNPYLGPIILDWEKHGVIRLKTKCIATSTMLILIAYPMIFIIQHNAIRAIIGITIAAVLGFIWTRPSTS
ncbi:YbaN family protein [Aliiglaciecola litoralis]|uniref:Inner membrane protein n=1 Tax=Aliiglaciecola litoralis TaxID=582857 RepID=A0ABN1LR39_9ALTE